MIAYFSYPRKLRSNLCLLSTLLQFVLVSVCFGQDRSTSELSGLVNLRVGEDVPSFLPWHVTGPHTGRAACPLCVYSQRPSAAIWTNTLGLADSVEIASDLDSVIEGLLPQKSIGYVVLIPEVGMNRREAENSMQAAFAKTSLKHVFLTVADQRGNAEDLAGYSVVTKATAATSTIVYVNRRATEVYQNRGQDANSSRQLIATIKRLFDNEEPYREIGVAMCSSDEPGEPLEFYGRVLDEKGLPLAKASVIAYNTDTSGHYAPRGSENRTPRIRGVAITNEDGWYRFKTIKPGYYPDADDPQHIHLHIDAAVHFHTYRTLWFEGDPKITKTKRDSLDAETVIVPLRRKDDGVWTVRYDVKLEGS